MSRWSTGDRLLDNGQSLVYIAISVINRRRTLTILRIAVFFAISAAAMLTLAACVVPGEPLLVSSPTADDVAHDGHGVSAVTGIDLLGYATVWPGQTVDGRDVGGLSAIGYDTANDRYLVLSDDTRTADPAAAFVAQIDVSDGFLSNGRLQFTDVITFAYPTGAVGQPMQIDPEGLAIGTGGSLYVASEGLNRGVLSSPPLVAEFTDSGTFVRLLPLPGAYALTDDEMYGVRYNHGFESLTISPDGSLLTIAVESPLVQDGPLPDSEYGAPARVLQYDLAAGEPVHEFVYLLDPLQTMPEQGERSIGGLAELLAVDDCGTLLALERNYVEGNGVDAKLYEVSTRNALDVNGLDALGWTAEQTVTEAGLPVQKRLLLDFSELGLPVANYEGMSFGPPLEDGRQTLLLVSDTDFSEAFPAVVLGLALTVEQPVSGCD